MIRCTAKTNKGYYVFLLQSKKIGLTNFQWFNLVKFFSDYLNNEQLESVETMHYNKLIHDNIDLYKITQSKNGFYGFTKKV